MKNAVAYLKSLFLVELMRVEVRGEEVYTKEKLLAVGDLYVAQIAADRAADAPYR